MTRIDCRSCRSSSSIRLTHSGSRSRTPPSPRSTVLPRFFHEYSEEFPRTRPSKEGSLPWMLVILEASYMTRRAHHILCGAAKNVVNVIKGFHLYITQAKCI